MKKWLRPRMVKLYGAYKSKPASLGYALVGMKAFSLTLTTCSSGWSSDYDIILIVGASNTEGDCGWLSGKKRESESGRMFWIPGRWKTVKS